MDKKRLNEKKIAWADKLDGIHWLHRMTLQWSMAQTSFSLEYGMEVMASSQVRLSTICRSMLIRDPDPNNKMMFDSLDALKEERDKALLRIQNYQHAAVKFYNKKAKNQLFAKGDFVLRKVFENTVKLNADKMSAHWEGSYLISKIVQPLVCHLLTMDRSSIPCSWNSVNHKRYYC